MIFLGIKRDDLSFLSKIAYITFEYYLIMCEKYSICDKEEFEKTKIYKKLISILKNIKRRLYDFKKLFIY